MEKNNNTISVDPTWYICIGIFTIFADQAIKFFFYLSKKSFIGNQYVEFIPILNTGLSFSFLSSYEYINYFIVLLTTICLYIFYIYTKFEYHNRKSILAETLVLSASISNLIDRLFHGGVIDYLRINIIDNINMPVGNLADNIILIALGYILINLLQKEL